MEDSQEWSHLIRGVRDGDDRACHDFWNQYGPMIERLASRRISKGMQRRIGPESVMLSACRTFFRRAQAGEFDLPDAEALWRLLCAITVNKVRMKTRYHSSQKRNLAEEVHPETMPDVSGQGQLPEEGVIFEEQLELLLSQFEGDEQKVLELKLEQHTNEEIAEKMGCSERTVRRMMKRIQARLSHLVDEEA